jgi:hypothetical protein
MSLKVREHQTRRTMPKLPLKIIARRPRSILNGPPTEFVVVELENEWLSATASELSLSLNEVFWETSFPSKEEALEHFNKAKKSDRSYKYLDLVDLND